MAVLQMPRALSPLTVGGAVSASGVAPSRARMAGGKSSDHGVQEALQAQSPGPWMWRRWRPQPGRCMSGASRWALRTGAWPQAGTQQLQLAGSTQPGGEKTRQQGQQVAAAAGAVVQHRRCVRLCPKTGLQRPELPATL